MHGAIMSQIIMRLAQLETPKKRGRKGVGMGTKNLDFFFLLIKKMYSIAIKFCSLVEDGVSSVIASFEEI